MEQNTRGTITNSAADRDYRQFIADFMRDMGKLNAPWLMPITRFAETFRTLATSYVGPTTAALEIGMLKFKLFHWILSAELGFDHSFGTQFRGADQPEAEEADVFHMLILVPQFFSKSSCTTN